MGTNPNDTYKRAVQELQTRLGRSPTTKDAEYVRLGEELRLSLMGMPPTQHDAREIARQESARTMDGWVPGPPQELGTRNARNDAREAGTVDRDKLMLGLGAELTEDPMGAPGAPVNSEVGPIGPDGDQAAGRIDDGAMAGSRGPSGGIIAQCEACMKLWERPKQRGRPAYRCQECRDA